MYIKVDTHASWQIFYFNFNNIFLINGQIFDTKEDVKLDLHKGRTASLIQFLFNLPN